MIVADFYPPRQAWLTPRIDRLTEVRHGAICHRPG